MIWVPFLWLISRVPVLIHGILSLPTSAVPQEFYDSIDLLFSPIRAFEGIFPVVTLTQVLILLLYVWIIMQVWKLTNSLLSYAPTWLVGRGKLPNERMSETIDLRR